MVTLASLTSFWVDEEIDMFITLMAQDPSRLLIPVKLELCELPPRLASRWWIDATTQTLTQVVDQLVTALMVESIPIVPLPSPMFPLPTEQPYLGSPYTGVSPKRPIASKPASGDSPQISRRRYRGRSTWRRRTGTGACLVVTQNYYAPLLSIAANRTSVISVVWSPDGTRIASASSQGIMVTVQVWDAN